MNGEQAIIAKLEGMEDLARARFDAQQEMAKTMFTEINRNKGSIDNLFIMNRGQEKQITDNKVDIQGQISAIKNASVVNFKKFVLPIISAILISTVVLYVLPKL